MLDTQIPKVYHNIKININMMEMSGIEPVDFHM
jgi:hypothetical protein